MSASRSEARPWHSFFSFFFFTCLPAFSDSLTEGQRCGPKWTEYVFLSSRFYSQELENVGSVLLYVHSDYKDFFRSGEARDLQFHTPPELGQERINMNEGSYSVL